MVTREIYRNLQFENNKHIPNTQKRIAITLTSIVLPQGAVYGAGGIAGETRERLWGELLMVTSYHSKPSFKREPNPWVWRTWRLNYSSRDSAGALGRSVRLHGVPTLAAIFSAADGPLVGWLKLLPLGVLQPQE